MTHPIFVIGPQRSGTRLASYIIARESGRDFIDELDYNICLLYTSDAADDTPCVDLGGRRII